MAPKAVPATRGQHAAPLRSSAVSRPATTGFRLPPPAAIVPHHIGNTRVVTGRLLASMASSANLLAGFASLARNRAVS